MKYAVMLHVGVVWNSCRCGMARCGLWNLRFEMWQCNVISDVEYGGPRRDVLQH